MISAHDILRQRLLTQAGLVDRPAPKFTLDELAASEWSPEFERLMRNRLIMGALRYGRTAGTREAAVRPVSKYVQAAPRLSGQRQHGATCRHRQPVPLRVRGMPSPPPPLARSRWQRTRRGDFMKTAFSTGPGFYEANTNKTDKSIPPGVIRIHCARLEAYDITGSPDDVGNEVQFTVLFAMAEKDKRLAKALLGLGRAINGNRKLLEEMAQ